MVGVLNARRTWTAERDEKLAAVWLDPTLTSEEAAARLGISATAAQSRASRLGLVRPNTRAVKLLHEPAPKRDTARQVWCLGPGSLGRPHKFLSKDPAYNRVCGECSRTELWASGW